MMPLTMATSGQELTLGGRGIRSRLYSMGLVPGVKLSVVGANGGPIMIAMNDTRLALGLGMAQKIIVE